MRHINSLKQQKTSSFDLSKYNHIALEKSSINITKYLNPLYELIGAGPHTSEWIKSKGALLLLVDKENGSLVCFAYLQISQLIQLEFEKSKT